MKSSTHVMLEHAVSLTSDMADICAGPQGAVRCAYILQELGHLGARVVLAHLAVALVPLPEVEHVRLVQVLAHFKGDNAAVFLLHTGLETHVCRCAYHYCTHVLSWQVSKQGGK